MFQNIFSSCIDNDLIFNRVLAHAKRFKANPNDINNRVEFKLFCQEHHLPMPEFPIEKSAFIEPFEMFNEPKIVNWLNNAKTIYWHEHNGINQHHINCKCQFTCNKRFFDCAPILLRQEQLQKMLTKEIKYRGQLFVWNKTFRSCLPTKIDAEKIQLIQTVGSGSFIYVDLNNPNVQN